MAHISLLMPSIKTKSTNYDDIAEDIYNSLGFKSSDTEIFKLVPVKSGEDLTNYINDERNGQSEMAIRVHSVNFNLNSVETIIKQRDHFKEQILKANEALKTYMFELRKLRKFISELAQKEIAENKGNENEFNLNRSLVLKSMKCVQLEDDNKKLRELLKFYINRTHVKNSESWKEETQSTVENLKSEFDLLIKV